MKISIKLIGLLVVVGLITSCANPSQDKILTSREMMSSGIRVLENFQGEFSSRTLIKDYRTIETGNSSKTHEIELLREVAQKGQVVDENSFLHSNSFSNGDGFEESQLVMERKIDVVQYDGEKFILIREPGNEKKYTQESSEVSSDIKTIKDTLNLLTNFLEREDLSSGAFFKFDEEKNEYVYTAESYDLNKNSANKNQNETQENLDLTYESGEVSVYLDEKYRITKVEIKYISKLKTDVNENMTVYDTFDNHILTKFTYDTDPVDIEAWIDKFNLIK